MTVPGAALGLGLRIYYGGLGGAVLSLAGAGLGCAIFLALYLGGGMGAGDVKLFGAVGALAGPQALVLIFVCTGLLGGIAAAGLAMARGRLRQTLANTGHLLLNFGRRHWKEVRRASSLDAPGALRLPYGAVIAGGVLVFLVSGL
jgi:prepilin peptidase CpaA